MVGLMGWFVPQILGVGYKYVGEVLNGSIAFKLMILLLAMKLVAVATSYASGNAGGIFGPSLFLGAMLGGIVGTVAQHFLPGYVASPGAYALVGMGTAFAGVIRAPMTSVVMIFEITRDYAVIVPLMISSLVSFFISSRFQKEPIYEVLAHQDGIHLPTSESRLIEGRRRVLQAMRTPKEVLTSELTVESAVEKMKDSRNRTWPVCNAQGVIGMVRLADLQKALEEQCGARMLMEFVDADDFPHVHSDQSLAVALERLGGAQLDVLPVVGRADVHKLEGIVTVRDVLAVYRVGPKTEE